MAGDKTINQPKKGIEVIHSDNPVLEQAHRNPMSSADIAILPSSSEILKTEGLRSLVINGKEVVVTDENI
ncbi:hypothetical protein Csa_014832 [Cucumis sativus]|uniref:Uncharacterized protein n=1 Tax=Cucumis sativus TaxID=3659 RepID=A0A0A0L0T8_CUCSA|nr:hypothetical protein Csa_014832 [Cucumis sativus]